MAPGIADLANRDVSDLVYRVICYIRIHFGITYAVRKLCVDWHPNARPFFYFNAARDLVVHVDSGGGNRKDTFNTSVATYLPPLFRKPMENIRYILGPSCGDFGPRHRDYHTVLIAE